ncbi:hypothetical protein, partial [Streptomyces sp. NPDC059063]
MPGDLSGDLPGRLSVPGGLPEGLPGQAWTAASGHVHDPNEVTVQIDGIGRHLAGESPLGTDGTRALDGLPDATDAAEGPVFVDETGRRSRRYRRIGTGVGLLCAGYAVVIVATLVSGNSSAPWLPVPDPKDEKPASQVDTPNVSAESGSSPHSSASPDATPSPASSRATTGPAGPSGAGGTTVEPAGEPDRAAPSAPRAGDERPGRPPAPVPTGDDRPGPAPTPGGDRPGPGTAPGPTRAPGPQP